MRATRDEQWVASVDGPAIRRKFWDYVCLKRVNDCWPWRGATNKGYGEFSVGTSVHMLAHRFSYYMEHGSLPVDLVVRHKCDNPSCVNPHHLTLGTQADNIHDAMERGRFHRRRDETTGRFAVAKPEAA